MIGAIIPQAQAAVASAAIIKNLLAGILPKKNGKAMLAFLAKDIGGWEFDYISDERVDVNSEITDHFTEENIYVQDHVAMKPIKLTMHGFVGDLAVTRKGLIATLSRLTGQVSSALAVVQPYVGKYSKGTASTMGKAVTETQSALNKIGKVMDMVSTISKLAPGIFPTKCEKAYKELKGKRDAGFVFTVVTPFELFTDMLIETLSLTSPDNTRGWTDITVTMKQIRFTRTLEFGKNNARGTDSPTKTGRAATPAPAGSAASVTGPKP